MPKIPARKILYAFIAVWLSSSFLVSLASALNDLFSPNSGSIIDELLIVWAVAAIYGLPVVLVGGFGLFFFMEAIKRRSLGSYLAWGMIPAVILGAITFEMSCLGFFLTIISICLGWYIAVRPYAKIKVEEVKENL